jgi:hypothetical protein
VVDAHHVLLDDGPLIEIARDEVRGGADEFDAACVRLLVRVCALEARQEGVVDVDDPTAQGCTELGGQDLHVASQYNQFDPELVDDVQHPVLERELLPGAGDGM